MRLASHKGDAMSRKEAQVIVHSTYCLHLPFSERESFCFSGAIVNFWSTERFDCGVMSILKSYTLSISQKCFCILNNVYHRCRLPLNKQNDENERRNRGAYTFFLLLAIGFTVGYTITCHCSYSASILRVIGDQFLAFR